jgi:hypothetical protein
MMMALMVTWSLTVMMCDASALLRGLVVWCLMKILLSFWSGFQVSRWSSGRTIRPKLWPRASYSKSSRSLPILALLTRSSKWW